MWQAPNQRLRALANAKKRERDRIRRPLHIKRVHAELKIMPSALGGPAQISSARIMLNDMTSKGVGIFSTELMHPGTEVQISISHPKVFFVRGRVTWCQEHDVNSHILSQTAYSYRVGIEFVFQSPEEEKQVKEYCALLAKDHIFNSRAA
jgi:hypothetical protein